MRRNQSALSLLFMILAFAISYELDRWRIYAEKAISFSFEPGPLLIMQIVSGLLITAVWAFLAWWILSHYSQWYVPLIFILAGLIILLYPPLRFLTDWKAPRPGSFYYVFSSFPAFSGAFIAVLGVISWLLARRRWSKDEFV
jgi:hypothetical protein